MAPSDTVETILIVDDEDSVRKSFREWLEGANLGCRILTAADAEAALKQAGENTIDLAILDWHLGAGTDGLHLLEDLTVFSPDVVAIMVTGFAHQATPLQAMRMGVRDYLDKNQDLNRTTFLDAVRRQLERIRPAKRERRIHHGLVAFRSAVEKVLPLVQAAAALQDPVPLPAAVHQLVAFLRQTTRARDGVLIVHSYDESRRPAESYRVYGTDGIALEGPFAPFARSIAGSVVSMQQSAAMTGLAQAPGAVELQPFERGRRSLLAVPLPVASGVQVVLELFDRDGPNGFTEADRHLATAAAGLGCELLRQALAERQTQRVLFDALEAALGASTALAETLQPGAPTRPEDPPPAAVLDRLRQSLGHQPDPVVDAADTVRLVEAIRSLAVRHGTAAVRHCVEHVEGLHRLLDAITGAEAAP
jgi:two-component system nitrogen regulation response regulator NtrX